MYEEDEEEATVLQPNDYPYRKYQKFTGLFIEGVNERVDKDDPDYATTDIVLPDGKLNYRFDEGVQGWRGMTSDELDQYLLSIRVPVPTTFDEMQALVTGQMTGLTKQMVTLVTANTQMSKQVIGLSQDNVSLHLQLADVQAQLKQLVPNNETSNNDGGQN